MAGKVAMHSMLKSKLLISGLALGLGLAVAQLPARDSGDDAPFGPGGANYKLPDPSEMFLLQEGGLKTTLKEEPLLNGIPPKTQILLYAGKMNQLHDKFQRTTLGKQFGRQDLMDYFQNLTGAFAEDYTKGDGSYTEQVMTERRLNWEMMANFYDKARNEFAGFVYWNEASEAPNFVMIAAFSNSVELSQEANVLKDYFQARREQNAHLSVVDRTHRTKVSATAIKQLNSDQVLNITEAYCIRNNLVIYSRGPVGIEDILNRMDDPSQSIDKVNEAFKTINAKAGTLPTSNVPADMLLTAHIDASFVSRLPAGMQNNLGALVSLAPGKAIDIGAGVFFDTNTGKVHERVFVVDNRPTDNTVKAIENTFQAARLLDPARTVIYGTTTGSVKDWQALFLKEQIFDNGVPAWLTTPAAEAALGGEVAVAYLSRDPANRAKADYLRTVLILEEKDPTNHAALDAWLVEAKSACGDAYKDDQGGAASKIPVGENAIIAERYLVNSQKDLEDLDRDGFDALLNRQPDEKGVEVGSRKVDQARNFYPAYTVITLVDNDNKPHNFVVLGYSVATLRQIINGVRQATNLNLSFEFRDRMAQFQKDEAGEIVYVNYPAALMALKEDILSGTDAELGALALGNAAVKTVLNNFRLVYDSLLAGVEPSAVKCIRIPGGYLVDGSSVQGNLVPIGLLLGYDGLHSRELEYQMHAAEIRSKLQSIKTALELYHAEAGRYPARDSLPQLTQFLLTEQYTADKGFEEKQTGEFERVFCLLPGNKLLPDVQQVKVPSQSNLVYVEGIEDRTLGSAVVVYEAKPSGKHGSFFCLQHDGRISTMSADRLAELLPPNDKVKNPYSQALVDALEAASTKKP